MEGTNPALENAHKIAQKKGFKGDINSFKNLISTNEGALGDIYNSVRSQGYNKDINSFKALVGIESQKKKSTSTSTSAPQKSVSVPQAGSSVGNSTNKPFKNLSTGENVDLDISKELKKKEVVKPISFNKDTTSKDVQQRNDAVLKDQQKDGKFVSASSLTKSIPNQEDIAESFVQGNDLPFGVKKGTEEERKFKEKRALELKSALQKHDQATTVDENFINEAVAEAEEIAGGNNTWENVKSGVKGAFNTFLGQNIGLTNVATKLGINPYQNTDPLAEEKTKERKRLIDSGVDPKKINEADVLNGAKKIYAENKIKDKKLSLSNDFYDNLDDKEKEALELKFTYDKSKLTDEENRLIQNLKITKARIKDLTFDAEPILAKIKNKEQISPEEFKIVENLDKQIRLHNDIYNDYQSNSKNLLSAAEELDLVKREYGEVQNFVADVGTAGLKIGLGALQTAKTALIDYNPAFMAFNELSKLNNGTEEAGGIIDEISSNIDLGLGKAQSELENWNQNTFRKNTENFNNVNDGINFVTDLIGNQAPNIALMIGTGGGSTLATRLGVEGNKLALGSIGTYSYGNKKNEMIGSNNSEDPNNRTYYSNTQIELASILYGGSEMFETATLGSLGKTKRFIGASLAEAPTRELFRKSIKENIISSLKSGSKDILEENIEEQVTNLIQNYTERNVLGRNEVGLFDNAGEVLKSSTAMALLLKAPQFAGAVAKKFQPKQYNDVLDNNAKEVLSLMNELKKEGLSKQTQDVIGAQITKLSQESDAIVKKTFERIGKLPAEQKEKIVELEKSTADLRAKAEAIQNDESLSKEMKENLIKDLSSEYKTQEDLRTKIVSEKATILDILPENEVTDLKKKAVETLLVENAGKNEANFTEEIIDKKAIELYDNKNQPVVEQTTTDTNEPATEVSPVQGVSNQITPTENVSPVENVVVPIIEKPSNEKQLQDVKNGNIVSFTYENKSEIPEIFKDKISSEGEVNGKKQIKVTIAKSLAEYHLQNEAQEINPIKDNETITFYTGRDKKISDFSKTRGENIFFSKNKDISNWYGGDESNVTEANIDTSNFIDLTSQEKKTKFVQENFTDKDIEELYKEEIKNEEDRDRFGKKSRQELIEKYRERAEENRFSGDGKEQNFLLKKIKEKGFSGVALKDSFFGEEDISYVVNDKSVIKTKNEAQAQGDSDANGDIRPSDAVVDQDGSANKGDNQGSVQQPSNLQGNNGQEIVLDDVANFLNEQFGAEKPVVKPTPSPVMEEDNKKATKSKQQLKDKANAEVDKIADKIKGLLPGIKDPNLKNQGFSQDQLIDLIASAVKNLVSAGIDINEAIKQVVDSVKAKFGDIDIDIEAVKERVSPKQKVTQQPIISAQPKQQNKKPIDKESIEKDSFEDMAGKMPNSGIVGEFLSGKTTEKTTGDAPEGNQEYDKIKLIEAFTHGKNIINKAIEQFGDNYVASILDYIENYQLNPENIALAYISLENHLRDMVKMNPTDITIKKQFDLVQSKRQNYAKSVAQAMNMAKLQNMAYYGYDLSETVDLIFTESQLETKRKIERAIQASADDINNEAEFQENEAENGIEEITIKAPKRKRNANVVKKELDDVWKNMLNDIAKSTKDGSLQTALPYQKQIIAATPHILKATQLLAELGTLSSKQIIDEIYNKLKTSFPDIERSDVVDIIKNENNKPKTISKIVKKALIDAGFGREVNITKKDENGNKVKEKRNILDWKKLAGEEGSVENIKKNVEETLKKQGYSEQDIKDIQTDLETEYTNLRASIIEKSLNELERRNTPKNINAKTHAQRLAELYNYGLFETNASEYDNLLNGLLGMNDFDNKTYEQLKQRGKALAELYATGLDPLFISTKIDELQKQINDIVYKFVFKNGPTKFKISAVSQEYMNLNLRMMLHSLGQIIQNPVSGALQVLLTKVGSTFTGTSNKALRKQRNKVALNILNDITGNAALSYGNVESNFTSHSKAEDIINRQSENRIYHRIISALLGKLHLEAMDSWAKSILASRHFTENLIKILTDKTNPNAMSKKDALNYVTEQLTGQSFEDAMNKAREIITKINEKNGKKIISDKEESVVRLADGIVKQALVSGGKITQEQLEASVSAGYISAGFSLGHEANNIISKEIGLSNANIDKKIKEAVKEKNYTKATLLTWESIFIKNMMRPFVGGGSNWIVLTLQKAGLDLYSLNRDNKLAKSEKIDLETISGNKNLKNALIRKTNAKNTNVRMLFGAMASISTFLLWYDDLDDEEKDKQINPLKKWLSENAYAKKYFNYISPTVLGLIIASENEELGKELGKILGIKADYFQEGLILTKAVKKINESVILDGKGFKVTNKEKYNSAKGDFGKLVGSKLNVPLPWRSVRDIENFYRGMNGLPEFKTNYKAKSFTDGLYKGGFVEYLISNPDKPEEDQSDD